MSNHQVKRRQKLSKNGSKHILNNVEEQIQIMRPSEELITYYQKKVDDLNKTVVDLEDQLDMCKKVCETNYYAQEELVKRNDEVVQLTRAVSDLQVYLYQEREHVLKLSADNDKLRLLHLDYQKKLDTVLSFAGLPKDFITFVCIDPTQSYVIPRKEPSSKIIVRDTLKRSRKELLKDVTSGQDEIQKLHVQSLMAEWEEQSELYRDEIHSLLSDRDLRQKEWDAEQHKLQKQVINLNNILKSVQSSVVDDTERLIRLEKRHKTKENTWTEEKECLLKSLEAAHGAFHTSPQNSNFLKCQLSCVKRQLLEKDGVISTYQEQNNCLEKLIEKMKEELDSTKIKEKEKYLKLTNQIKFFKQKCEDEKRRRLLDAEGFRTDIKFLRDRVQTLERKVFINTGLVQSCN